jgi:hypothetical protein
MARLGRGMLQERGDVAEVSAHRVPGQAALGGQVPLERSQRLPGG